MIIKQDILDRAAEWQLRPDIVEKDYVLGWVLAALGAHDIAGTRWVFKGGTCIKILSEAHRLAICSSMAGRRGRSISRLSTQH
jgi:predicted nucleotidyltransferase component of viral defense system